MCRSVAVQFVGQTLARLRCAQADGTRYLSRHVSISTIMDYLLQKYCEDGLPEGEEPSVRTLRRVWNNDPIFANVRIPLKGQWGICNHVSAHRVADSPLPCVLRAFLSELSSPPLRT